jgi:hypothetical protein
MIMSRTTGTGLPLGPRLKAHGGTLELMGAV